MTLRPSVAGTLILLGVLAAPASAQQNGPSLDGRWTGHTSRGGTVVFKIEAGTVRTLEIDWNVHLDAVCPGKNGSAPSPNQIERGDLFFFNAGIRGSEPPKVRFPDFKVSREVETPQAAVTMAIAGNFSSDNAVAGDITLTAAGCVGHETFGWKADRKVTAGGH